MPIKEFAHPGKERRLPCPSTSSCYRDSSNVYIKVMPLSQSMKIKICKHVLLFLLVFSAIFNNWINRREKQVLYQKVPSLQCNYGKHFQENVIYICP